MPVFEIQIQGRFLREPTGSVFVGLQLEQQVQMGFIARTLASVLLTLFQAVAAGRGTELRSSFGSADELPHLAVPLDMCERRYLHDEPVTLPILGDERFGAFRVDSAGNIQEELPKSSARPRANTYMTWTIGTPHLDWHEWKVIGLPGLQSLALEQFWGEQPANVIIFEEDSASRRQLFGMRFHAPLIEKAAPEDNDAKEVVACK